MTKCIFSLLSNDSSKELSSNSAASPDGFPASLLINYSDILAPAFEFMFCQSLTQGFSPSALRRAAVVPIYKSGDKSIRVITDQSL